MFFKKYPFIYFKYKTIYYIKDKDTFFDNCSLLLTSDGLLIIHLIDREKFKPFIINSNDKTVLYNPEKHNNTITRNLIKINSNLEYVCEYEKNDSYETNKTSEANELTKIDNLNNPYSYYKETFQNVETNSVRKNIINLYMPTIEEILAIAKIRGFVVKDKQPLDIIDHNNEFLFILKKVS